MPVSRKLREYLEKNGISYQVFSHREAFTAQEVAASQHVSGKKVIKAVVLKGDGEYFLAAMPAHLLVDLEKIKDLLRKKSMSLATEDEMRKLFPEVDVGAEPPLGSLYGLKTIVDEHLKADVDIVFNAGTHTETIKIKFKDFEKLEKPIIGDICKEQP